VNPAVPALLAGPTVLAGIDPKDASPGIGAFIAFLVLAVVVLLLAWSFTRHQRKIRANAAAREHQLRQQAEAGRADEPAAAGESAAAAAAGGDANASSPEEPSSSPEPPGAGEAPEDGGGSR